MTDATEPFVDAPAAPGSSRAALAQAAATGLLMAAVGFGSSFAVVVHGLQAMGATPAQAASGLMVTTFAMGALSIVLSLAWRTPISIAWSTPGAAVLATTGATAGGFSEAVGAFIVAGLLVLAAGLFRPLGRLASSIPRSLASAMLAGVLLKLCLAPFEAIAKVPAAAVAVIVVFVVAQRFARLYAGLIAVAAALALTAAAAPSGGLSASAFLPAAPEFVAPTFSWAAAVGVGLPLFVVTMASQNVTGLAVLTTFGYRPSAGPIFVATGAVSAAIAAFGALTVNLAAITAALGAGPDAHPDPAKRWIASLSSGLAYVVMALVAGGAVAALTASPPVLVQAAAGLALFGAFGSSIVSGLADESDRPAALVTFLLAASGLAFGGIGSAFWGLLVGLATLAIHGRLRRRAPA